MMSKSFHFTEKIWIHFIREKSHWIYHRWFLHFKTKEIQIEYGTCKCFGVEISRNEDGLSFYIGLWIWSTWITFKRFLKYYHPGGDLKCYEGRALTLGIYDWSLWWNFWTPINSWSKDISVYRQGSFDIPDFLFGKLIYSNKFGKKIENIKFEWREKNYIISNVQWEKSEWIRSRLPKWIYHRIYYGAAVNFNGKHDFPMHRGKGTTSYNCEDDGILGCSIKSAKTLDTVIIGYAIKCQKDLIKYGRTSDDNLSIRYSKLKLTDERCEGFGKSIYIN